MGRQVKSEKPFPTSIREVNRLKTSKNWDEWYIHPWILNFFRAIEISRLYVLLRTAISQKPVVGCPRLPHEQTDSSLDVLNIGLWLNIRFLQKLISGWNVELAFKAREYSLLPYLETLVTDIHFQQMAAARWPYRCFKTRVLHFRLKNTPLKDKKMERESSKEFSAFLLCRKGSFSSRNQIRGTQRQFLRKYLFGRRFET